MQENNCFQKVVDTSKILGLFSEEPLAAKRQFDEYIKQEGTDLFIDLEEKVEKVDEENAQRLFYEMMNGSCEGKRDDNTQITEAIIREFREKTKLSKRQIAAITGLNKDKFNKMLRTRQKNRHCVFTKIMLARLNQLLAEKGELSLENIFFDGTKMEAAANKYTFVWKHAVTKNLQKLLDKIPALFQNAETFFEIRVLYDKFIHMYHVKKLRKKLKQLQQAENIVFVHGIGKRKSQIQRMLEQVDEAIYRLKKYVKYLHIAGKRNSFSKTDQDATFMRLKEDAMKNGQLKPAYNIQFGVDAEYVVWITAGPQPTDTTTLIPFLNEQETFFAYRYNKVVADSGYESEENYLYLESHGQAGYIKPSNYEQSKTRKYKKDIGRRENMPYDEMSDSYLCANGKKITKDRVRRVKSRTGYVSKKTLYSCKDCAGCMYKAECIKGRNSRLPLEERSKHFEVAKTFQAKRMESLERIGSEEGQLLRMNRSIQSEGAFGEVKWNMEFRRFLCRGTENVLAESILLGFAHNVNKLHSKIQNGHCGEYLYPLKTAQ